MHAEPDDRLDDLIREEKHRVASHFMHEAWENALEEGIEEPILAKSAVEVALTRLHDALGEDGVREAISGLSDRLESGHFDATRVLQ